MSTTSEIRFQRSVLKHLIKTNRHVVIKIRTTYAERFKEMTNTIDCNTPNLSEFVDISRFVLNRVFEEFASGVVVADRDPESIGIVARVIIDGHADTWGLGGLQAPSKRIARWSKIVLNAGDRAERAEKCYSRLLDEKLSSKSEDLKEALEYAMDLVAVDVYECSDMYDDYSERYHKMLVRAYQKQYFVLHTKIAQNIMGVHSNV